jgi:pantoate--beta-alanine ligase
LRVLERLEDLRRWRAGAAEPLGFVPTMGYLHEGHLALIDRARAECATVVVSIFVNPLQVGPGEDFDRYPRDRQRDLEHCRQHQVDAVWLPQASEMYPPGFSTFVEVRGLDERLCGRFRPGHFRGVATVVAKLFHQVQPQRAYFGEKDYQQLLIIRRMVRDLDMPIDIVACPTVREPDGLARSSRNAYLTPEERRHAARLPAALRHGLQLIEEGERDPRRVVAAVEGELAAQVGWQPQYVEILDAHELTPLDRLRGEVVLAAAVYVGQTRLIDNVRIVVP